MSRKAVVSARDPVDKLKVDGDAEVDAVLWKDEDLQRACQKLDEFFVWPERSRPDIAHDRFDFELPIIDLSPVLKMQTLHKELEEQQANGQAKIASGTEEEIRTCLAAKANVEREIRAACEKHGFFQIINHGFPMSLVEQLTQTFVQLFDLPLEVKTEVSADYSGANKKDADQPAGARKSRLIGYNPIKRSNAITKTNGSHIWNEGFELESPENMYPGATEDIASTLWPEQPQIAYHWRSTAEEYGKQASKLSLLLLDLMAGSLELPDGSLEEFLGYSLESQALARLRMNYFPLCPQPELTWGLHGHTDPSVITLLHQDDVGGLQIKFEDGTWHGVRPIPGAFVVNVADYLQAWTNARFISAQHRVVANNTAERYSIGYFVVSERESIITPRPELVDAKHPLRYRSFSRAEYLKSIYSGGLSSPDKEHLLDRDFAAETQA